MKLAAKKLMLTRINESHGWTAQLTCRLELFLSSLTNGAQLTGSIRATKRIGSVAEEVIGCSVNLLKRIAE
jgi:hypothetical protein